MACVSSLNRPSGDRPGCATRASYPYHSTVRRLSSRACRVHSLRLFREMREGAMKIFTMCALLALGSLLISWRADGACVCTCVEGQNVPLCSSPVEPHPACPAKKCPRTTRMPQKTSPSINPTMPKPGSVGCRKIKIRNLRTGMYEWQTVCTKQSS